MRLVMMKICDCADQDGCNVFPAVATIQRETGLKAQSTVRDAIAAFEEAGLLIVKGNQFGGNTTTVRELDTDKLRLVTGQRRKGEKPYCSTHVLRCGEIEIPGDPEAERGDVVVVFVPGAALPSYVEKRKASRTAQVMAIFPRANGDVPAGYEPPPSIVQAWRGATPPLSGEVATDVTPPMSGAPPSDERSPPLRSADPTPPLSGANPSLEPSPERYSPLSPRPRGEQCDVWIDEVRQDKPGCGRALDKLFAPLLAKLPFKATNPRHRLSVLAEFAEAQSDEVLAEALRLLLMPGRKGSPTTDVRQRHIEKAIADARALIDSRGLAERGPLLFPGTAPHAEALAKVAAVDPTWAAELRGQPYIKRSTLRAYGVEQAP